jgi:uncharacterized membrane-anchored protein
MKYLLLLGFVLFTNIVYPSSTDSLLVAAIDSIENQYQFDQRLIIPIKDLGILTLNENFKFLNEEKANEFTRNYWGTLDDKTSYLGIILQKNKSIFDTSALLFTVYYLPNLYIDNSNHEILENEQLLKSLIAKSDSNNSSEMNEIIEPVKVINWAISPRFSKELNCLYWSEEIVTGTYATKKQISTHFRFLGKHGVMSFDCVSSANSFNFLKNEIDAISTFFKFNALNEYSKTAINSNFKDIEFLIIDGVIEESNSHTFFFKYWKAIFFICGICGVIFFYQFKTTKN